MLTVLLFVGDFLLVERPRVGKAQVEDMTASCSKRSDIHFSYSNSHSKLGSQLLPLGNYIVPEYIPE